MTSKRIVKKKRPFKYLCEEHECKCEDYCPALKTGNMRRCILVKEHQKRLRLSRKKPAKHTKSARKKR